MKKKMIIVSVITILIILLFPIRNQLKDGGTVEYKALVYKVSKVKKLILIEEMEQEGKIKEYDQGIIIEILGFEIYNNVKGKNGKIEYNKESETDERIVRIGGTLYYEDKEAEKYSPTCGTKDGYITSHVKSNEIPTEDNQSNFEGDYGYQYVYTDTMVVLTEEGWVTFKAIK